MAVIRSHTNGWYVHYLHQDGQHRRAYFIGANYNEAQEAFYQYADQQKISVVITQVTRLYVEHDHESKLIATGETVVIDYLLAQEPETLAAYEQLLKQLEAPPPVFTTEELQAQKDELWAQLTQPEENV